MRRLDKFIRTREDWYSSYPPKEGGNPFDVPAALVSCIPPTWGGFAWGVCVQGTDDFGMAVYKLTQAEAKSLYDSISDFMSRVQLQKMGLHYV